MPDTVLRLIYCETCCHTCNRGRCARPWMLPHSLFILSPLRLCEVLSSLLRGGGVSRISSLLLCILELGLFLLWGVDAHVGFPAGIGAWLLASLRVDLGDELLVLQVIRVEVHLPVYPHLAVDDAQQIVELDAGADGPVSLVQECCLLFLSKVPLVGVLEELVQGELFAVLVLGAFFRTNAELLGNILVKLQIVAVEELQVVSIAVFGTVINDLELEGDLRPPEVTGLFVELGSKELSVLYPEVCSIGKVQYGVRTKFLFGLSLAYRDHYRAFLGDSCASWSYESFLRTRGLCRGWCILRLECR